MMDQMEFENCIEKMKKRKDEGDFKTAAKIAIVGTNGVGKSTLIKTLLGILPHTDGTIEWGRNVKAGYYDQHNSYLTGSKTMLDELWDMFPRSDELTLRTALGRARLTGDNVFKRIDVLSGGEKGVHGLMGIGAGFVPSILNRSIIDEIITVTEEQAYEAAREVAVTDGLLIGISSGAALYAAKELALRINDRHARIVVLFPDGGERYLSTPLYGG